MKNIFALVLGGLLLNATFLHANEQQRFVEQYIQAVNSDNLSALKKLSHPSYLQCIDDSNNDYYSELFNRSLKRYIPEDYKVVFQAQPAESLTAELEGAKRRGLPYPVRPTHQMQLDYNKGEYSSVTIVRKLVLEGGKYYEVSGCPTPQLVERFRQLQVKKAAEREQALELFNLLEEPLLGELKTLLQQGQKIQAWKRYSQETGVSIGTAKEVLSNIPLGR